MRRGRYGNRVSFKVSLDKPELYSVEELKNYLEEAIKRYNSLFCLNIPNETIKVIWPNRGGS